MQQKKTPLSNVLIIQHIRIYNPEKETRNSLEEAQAQEKCSCLLPLRSWLVRKKYKNVELLDANCVANWKLTMAFLKIQRTMSQFYEHNKPWLKYFKRIFSLKKYHLNQTWVLLIVLWITPRVLWVNFILLILPFNKLRIFDIVNHNLSQIGTWWKEIINNGRFRREATLVLSLPFKKENPESKNPSSWCDLT